MQKSKLNLPRPEICFALLTRGAQGATMLVAALCVAWRLTVEEQGFFFVFMSFGALLQLSDFGLSYAALQTASHFKTVGDTARFIGFRDRAKRINLMVLSGAAVLVGGLGALVFSAKPDAGGVGLQWVAPWAVFVAALWAAQLANLELVLIEGGSSPSAAWRFRWVQESLGGCLFIVALIGGAGLWSLSAYGGMRAALAALWLSRTRFRLEASAKSGTASFDWRKEVWPFQWRMGLSGLSGFLIFQAFNPIVLVEQGSVAAGRFGMSLAMMNMLLLITTVWPLSQVSRYVSLIAQRRLADVQRAFWRMLVGSSLFAALLALGLFLAVWWMSEKSLPFAGRVADVVTTGALLTTAVVHHVVHCFAVILRAERQEPLLAVSIFGGLLTVLVVWIFARYGGLSEIALANLGCALIGIPIVMIYYKRSATRWCSDEKDYCSPARS